MIALLLTVLLSLSPVYVPGWTYTHGDGNLACAITDRTVVACANPETHEITIDLRVVSIVAAFHATVYPESLCADWWYVYQDALRHENLHALGFGHGPDGGFVSDQCRKVGTGSVAHG